MNNRPLTKKELYEKLKTLQPLMEQFKETGEVQINSGSVELMQEVYPSVQVLSQSAMPVTLNAGCPSCIQEAFHVFISLYDRLAADPHVTDSKPPIDGVGKGDGVEAVNKDTGVKELTEAEEDELLELIGLKRDNATVPEYSKRLNAYMEGLEDPKPAALLIKQSELTKALEAMPPVNPKAKKADKPEDKPTLETIYKRLALVGIDTEEGEVATIGTVLGADYPATLTDEERAIVQSRYDELVKEA